MTTTLTPMQIEQAHGLLRRFSRTALVGMKDSLGLSTVPLLSGLVLGYMRFDAGSDADRTRITEAHYSEVLSAYGRKLEVTSGKPFPYAGNGTAVIPVHGSLLNRYNYAAPHATGYNAIRSMMNAALADPDVSRIVLDINSPGGQAAGCFELCEDIRAARAVKPVHAVVDAGAFSAAYAIASAASDITVTPSGEVGSIGVVSMHMNLGPVLEKIGVDLSFIFAGKHKIDGNPFEALPDDVRANIQVDVDRFYDRFISTVAKGRDGKITEEAARNTEAQCFDAETGMQLGLVDAIKSADAALASFEATTTAGGLLASDEPHITIDEPEEDTPTMTEIAAAIAADRTRINSILGHEEAKGRESLAQHLATKTDMSVELAVEALKAAPKAAPAEGNGSPLDRAMDRVTQPNVGAGGEGDEPDADANTPSAQAARIKAAYGKATGRTSTARH